MLFSMEFAIGVAFKALYTKVVPFKGDMVFGEIKDDGGAFCAICLGRNFVLEGTPHRGAPNRVNQVQGAESDGFIPVDKFVANF